MLRNLVPALGALALCSAAPAQEIAKGLYLDGWVDTVFSVVNQPNYIPTGAAFSQQDASTDFYAKASLKVGWNVTDRVKTKVNIWFNNGDTAFAGATTAGDNIYMREAYIAVDAGNGITWTIGKFINHLGWTSAEPPASSASIPASSPLAPSPASTAVRTPSAPPSAGPTRAATSPACCRSPMASIVPRTVSTPPRSTMAASRPRTTSASVST